MRTRGWLVVAVSVVPLSAGCGIYRINHLHSDANQKRMDRAAEAFAQVSSRRVGLDPILLKNLEASAALRRTVADARNRLHDGLTATAVSEKSWLTLRYDLLADLGVELKLEERCVLAVGTYESRRSKDPTLRPTTDELRCITAIAQRDETRTAITETIERRIVRVQAISKVLGTLIAGQTALVTAAKDEIAAGTTPPKSPPATKTFPDLVVELARAVTQAGAKASAGTRSQGTAVRGADLAREEADALLRTILAAAERSRDPSSIYALAALVRTGLRKRDFAMLDDLLLDLTTGLEPIVQGARGVAAAGGAVPPAWKDFHDRLIALGAVVPVGALHAQLRPEDGARAERAATVYRVLKTTAPSIALALPQSPAPGQGPLSRDEVKQLRQDAAEVRKAMHTLRLLPTELEDVTVELAMLTTGLRTAVKDLKTIVEATKIDFTPGANAEATAVAFLSQTLGATPELTSRGALSASAREELSQQLAALGAIVQDVGRERSAVRERLVAFVKALRRLQLDLHEETLRHYEAVSAIAARDIKRWALLEHLDEQYSGVFYGTPNPSAPDLFLSQADLDSWHARHGIQKPSCAARPGCHPPIDKADLILPSVRRLAETAREWQRASPNRDDPRGYHAQISSLRLTSAVRTINAQMLMLSVNRAMADDNAIRLATEVAEHDLHVDAIVARGAEAEITLAIGDLQAFHASGITTGDIQNVIGLVQSVLLAYIGGKI